MISVKEIIKRKESTLDKIYKFKDMMKSRWSTYQKEYDESEAKEEPGANSTEQDQEQPHQAGQHLEDKEKQLR